MLLSIASGLILALALPRPGTWVAAWIGLVPIMLALRGMGAWRAGVCGLITGLVYYGIILHWISLFGYLPWFLLITYQALYIAIFAAIYVRLQPTKIGWLGYAAVPAAWVTLQFIRTLGTYAFTWGSFAHTQADNLLVAQIASITGPWGIDFLVCLVNLVLATAVFGPLRKTAPIATACVLIAATCAFGFVSLNTKNTESNAKPIAIIQGGVSAGFDAPPDYTQRAWNIYKSLTTHIAKNRPEVIVWPETSLPADISTPPWNSLLCKLANSCNTELFVGAYDTDPKTERSYNSLFRCNSHIEDKAYHKVRLVPFGEFVPMRKKLSFLKNYGVRPDDLLAGENHVLLDSKLGKLGVSICFESLFSAVARSETRAGAKVLCVVTNDSWFQRSQAAHEHLMMAQLRAIENRRFVLRAAQTGISALIDPYGRVRSQLGIYRHGAVFGKVQPSAQLTLYSKYGDWFAFASIAIIILGAAVSVRSARTSLSPKPRREI